MIPRASPDCIPPPRGGLWLRWHDPQRTWARSPVWSSSRTDDGNSAVTIVGLPHQTLGGNRGKKPSFRRFFRTFLGFPYFTLPYSALLCSTLLCFATTRSTSLKVLYSALPYLTLLYPYRFLPTFLRLSWETSRSRSNDSGHSGSGIIELQDREPTGGLPGNTRDNTTSLS